MRRVNLSKFMPGIAWFFVVLVLICLPGKDIPATHWFDKIYLDKWVHTGIFALLSLLFMLPFALSPMSHKQKLRYFIAIAIATSLWGLTTEFIQKYWVPGRSFDLFDWAADSLGAFTSFIICRKRYLPPP